MGNDEEIGRLQELAGTMRQMLRDLHNNYGWDELDTTLEEVEAEAEALKLP